MKYPVTPADNMTATEIMNTIREKIDVWALVVP